MGKETKRNVVLEVLHATKLIKTKRANIEELEVKGALTADNMRIIQNIWIGQNIEIGKDLVVSGTISNPSGTVNIDGGLDVKNKLKVGGDTNITGNVTIEKNATVKGNLSVKGDSTFAGVSADSLKDPNKKLYGTADEIKKLTPGCIADSGKIDKPPRVDHTHPLPESIKNPHPINFYSAESSIIGSYDGSQELNLRITPGQIGAAPRNHASATTNYGVGNGDKYGHVKLTSGFEHIELDPTNGILNISDTRGSNDGYAVTPNMISGLANSIKSVFITKKEAGDIFIKSNQTEIIINGTFKIRNSVYLGGSDNNPSDNMLVVYGAGDSTIAKVKLGNGDLTSVLTSPNDNNLYIQHRNGVNFYRKLSSFYIEKLIVWSSNTSLRSRKCYRKWRPARTGWYRIYLIGSGGVGANGWVLDNTTIFSSPIAGFGVGTSVKGGSGGGGGCVCITDLLVNDIQSNSYISSVDDSEGDSPDENDADDGNEDAAYAYFSFPEAKICNTSTKRDGSASFGTTKYRRCAAVEGLETFGTIVSKIPNTTIGRTSNIDTVSLDPSKIVKYYDAFAGHGHDSQSTSHGQQFSTGTTDADGNVIYAKAVAGYNYEGYVDSALGECYGGSAHYKGGRGNGIQNDLAYTKIPVTTAMDVQSAYTERVKTARQDGFCGGYPGGLGVHGFGGVVNQNIVGTPAGNVSALAYYDVWSNAESKVVWQKCYVNAQSGTGGKLMIRELDNYMGDFFDGDPSIAYPDKMLAVPTTKGGDGWLGGGNGGGYCICRNTSKSESGNKSYVKPGANRSTVVSGPCAIVVYMGNKLDI